jgi:hypothetical protein
MLERGRLVFISGLAIGVGDIQEEGKGLEECQIKKDVE